MAPTKKRKNEARPTAGKSSLIKTLLPPVRELAARPTDYGWLLLSALLFRLCFAPTGLWPLGFVALAPWFWALRGKSVRGAFWLSWIFGSIASLTMYTWLTSVSRFNPAIYLGIPLLSIFQGVYIAAAGAGIVALARRLPITLSLLAAIPVWVSLEWLRSIGPFANPFILLGNTVHGFLPLAQITSIGGVLLLSAIVLAVNLSVMEATAAWKMKAIDFGVALRLGGSLAVVVLVSVWGGGVMRATSDAEAESPTMRVALLQPNVEQGEKFASYSDPDPLVRMTLADRMARDLFAMIDSIEPGTVDLIVAPESAITNDYFDIEDYEAQLQAELRERVDRIGATLIVGANDFVWLQEDGSYTDDLATRVSDYPESFVSLYVFRPGDTEFKVAGDYRKIHLMPFGETVPILNMFPYISENIVQIGEFMRGDREQPPIFVEVDRDPTDPTVESKMVHIGPTICFEDMFPYLHNRLARRNAQVFVNITNNAWFDPSLGSRHHFDHARIRAIETRRPVVFATNTGVTAVVDGAGRVAERLPLREEGVLMAEVPVRAEPPLTIYARFGNWVGLLSLLLAIGMWVFLGKIAPGRREA